MPLDSDCLHLQNKELKLELVTFARWGQEVGQSVAAFRYSLKARCSLRRYVKRLPHESQDVDAISMEFLILSMISIGFWGIWVCVGQEVSRPVATCGARVLPF